jgi:hypothetical protein
MFPQPFKEQTSRPPVIFAGALLLEKEFQDEQTATGKFRRLPRIGDSGFRAIAEQFNDKFTHRGPAADQQSEFRLVIHNDATFDVDTIGHDIDTEYALYRFRPNSAFKPGG